jgi:hypothetical protein
VLRFRVDVRHAPLVASYFDRAFQTGDAQLTVDLCESITRERAHFWRRLLRLCHRQWKE